MGQNDQPMGIDAGDIPMSISPDSSAPLYLQLAEQLQALIESRALPAATKLPSTRALARAIGVNRNSVVAAFERLTNSGHLETHGRHGTLVSTLASPSRVALVRRAKRVSAADDSTDSVTDFRLGSVDPNPLPINVWRRACREAGRQLPGSGYGDPQGEANLRAQIALYLGRTHAMHVEPSQVLITAGSGQAIERIAEIALPTSGLGAFEDPGYPRAADSFRRAGGRLLPIPVDEDGLDTEVLVRQRTPPRVIHVTPAHQYPLGARLSSSRRHALITWARKHGSLIIENDYDGEFRYDSPPLPALASLAGFDHVAYVGTFSKVLTPAIRLGFVVGNIRLIRSLAEVIDRTRESISIVTQRIMAWMIKSGELEKHIRRTRRHYRSRRMAMLRALGEVPEVICLSGQSAGLHVVVELQPEISARDICARLKRAGILVDRVSDFQFAKMDDKRLLMAYAHLPECEIVKGVRKLARALKPEREGVR